MDHKLQKIKDHYDTTSTETSKDANASLLDVDVAKDTHRSLNQSETTILPDDYTTQSVTSMTAQEKQQKIEEYEMTEHKSTDTTNGYTHKQPENHEGDNGTVAGNHTSEYTEPPSLSRPGSQGSLYKDGQDGDVNQNQSGVDKNVAIAELTRRSSVRFSSRRLSRCSSRASSRSHRGLAPVMKRDSTVEEIKDPEVC